MCFDTMLTPLYDGPPQSLADKLSDWGWTVEPNGLAHVVFLDRKVVESLDGD